MIIASILTILITLNMFPLTTLGSASSPSPPLLAPPIIASNNGTVAVSPTMIGDTTNFPLGHRFDVSIKVENASSFNLFDVSVMTESSILRPLAITPGDVFSEQVFAFKNCVNAVGLGCNGLLERAGVATLSQTTIGAPTPNRDNATLFTVTYNVTGIGATQIRVLTTTLSIGQSQYTNVKSQDGFFSNKTCGAVLCRVPNTSFTVNKNGTLVQGRAVFFNASASVTTNSGASIANYKWFFGSGDSFFTRINYTSYTYSHAGSFVVVLQVNDTSLAYGIFSYNIHVFKFLIDLAIGPNDLSIDQTTLVLPGTLVHIQVTVTNLSSKSENETVSVILERGAKGNLTLNQAEFMNVSLTGRTHLDATWDTTDYAPKVYPIVGRVNPVRNGTLLVENVTSNNEVVGFVQLIDAMPVGGASLSLVTGISLVGLVAVAGGVGVARRLFLRKPELDVEV